MGWLPQVLAILQVIERTIPIVERWLPKGRGKEKATMVTATGQVVATTLLPGARLDDPRLAPLVQAKLDADVALANALQAIAEGREVSTVPILDTRPAAPQPPAVEERPPAALPCIAPS